MTEAEFEQCINRICNGDKNGLKDIYTEYMPYLYKVIYGIVGNKEFAEDITSDFFVKLWSVAHEYKAGKGHKGYLAAIARNMAIDQLRRSAREVPVAGFDMEGVDEKAENRANFGETEMIRAGTKGNPESAKTPEEQVIADMSLKEALGRLKPEERRIIDMKVLSEMTFKEIAEMLGIPIGTVTWRYQEGIRQLRRCGYE